MTAKPKHPPGPPMALGNMCELGVYHLIAFCRNNACRHQALIDVSKYPDETEVHRSAAGEMRQVRRPRCGRAPCLPIQLECGGP